MKACLVKCNISASPVCFFFSPCADFFCRCEWPFGITHCAALFCFSFFFFFSSYAAHSIKQVVCKHLFPEASLIFFLSHIRLFNLSEENYQTWSQAIIMALKAKNKLGFIDSTLSPSAISSNDFSQRNRCNNMVKTWLLNSVSKEISLSVI